MKTLIGMLLTILASSTALASSNLISNPYLPYPPGCARMPDPLAAGGVESEAVKFYEREIDFYSAQAGEEIPLTLRLFRAPCSEPNRSLVWLEFVLAAEYSYQDLEVQLPTVVAEVAPNWRKPMSLAIEPNGWGSGGMVDREATYLLSQLHGLVWYYGSPAGERRWVYLLDNAPPFWDISSEYGLTASEYNGAFKLVLRYNPYDFLSIDIPSTSDLLPATTTRIPLSGRLSGSWVIAGTADQGVMLSVSEMVLPNDPEGPNDQKRPMLVFLAHYTFDANGDMLWLTGAAEFRPGALKVTIPMEKVNHGSFRDNVPADREMIGAVTLRSRSCNDIGFEFDYSALGLGAGQRRMQRLFSLETAGYDCRDYEAKVAANH